MGLNNPAESAGPGGVKRVRLHAVRRGVINILFVAFIATIAATGVAWAAPNFDTILPTQTYNEPCPQGSGPCKTDNEDVYYYMDSVADGWMLEEADQDGVREMIRNEYVMTDLNVYYDPNPTWTGAGETDLVYREGPVAGDASGVTYCNDKEDGSVYLCDQQYIEIENGLYYYHLGISCHETGHGVGLMHGVHAYPKLDNQDDRLGCMKKLTQPSQPLGDLSRNNINYVY